MLHQRIGLAEQVDGLPKLIGEVIGAARELDETPSLEPIWAPPSRLDFEDLGLCQCDDRWKRLGRIGPSPVVANRAMSVG